MTIGGPAFCLALHLAGVHFLGALRRVGGVGGLGVGGRPVGAGGWVVSGCGGGGLYTIAGI